MVKWPKICQAKLQITFFPICISFLFKIKYEAYLLYSITSGLQTFWKGRRIFLTPPKSASKTMFQNHVFRSCSQIGDIAVIKFVENEIGYQSSSKWGGCRSTLGSANSWSSRSGSSRQHPQSGQCWINNLVNFLWKYLQFDEELIWFIIWPTICLKSIWL